MLFAFQKKGGDLLLFFINIIYHEKAMFSSARVRVCEVFQEKCQKIAGNGLCRRFDIMFDFRKISKTRQKPEQPISRFFDKMSLSALDFSAFGGMLLHTPFLRA